MILLFLTSAHNSNDDRIYYHQAKAFEEKGHFVIIYSTFGGINLHDDKIKLIYDNHIFNSKKQKINSFFERCKEFNPDAIICSEPIPILGAAKYKKQKSNCKIYYDVTEFYPSKKNLIGKSGVKKLISILAMGLLNFRAASLADGFIFGEHYKSLYYKSKFRTKPFIEISYFQDLNYFSEDITPPEKFTFGYTGKFSEEKGIIQFAHFLKAFREKYPELDWEVKLIGWFENERVKKEFELLTNGIKILSIENLSLKDYCNELSTISVFFDLRDVDAENNLCLPIKLFTYSSAGRPIIYTPIHAIQHAYPNLKFVEYINIKDLQSVSVTIQGWIEDPYKFKILCQEARFFAENHHWNSIKGTLVRFLTEHE